MKSTVAEFENYQSLAVADPTLVIKSSQIYFYPYVDFISKEATVSAALVSRVVDGANEHTVVVSLNISSKGEEVMSVWCADKFLDGRLGAPEAEKRGQDSAGGAALVGPQAEAAVRKMLECHAIFGESGACSFWSKWRNNKALCGHTSAVLATMRDTRPTLLQELRDHLASLGAIQAFVLPGDTYSLAELAFRVPVLIEGDRGAGKTFDSRKLAREGNYGIVECNGHEGVESSDLFGFLVPVAGHEGLVWKDGPLSKAFRMAQTRKTVLLFDELLRIRQRELSALLTALSPDMGMYRLPTGRIVRVVDGVGEEEVLEVPVCNLAVVATTNVGGEYAVDLCDPALAERFVILRKDTEVGRLTEILALLCKERGYSTKVVKRLVEFFTKMTAAKSNGVVADIPTTRTLSRAIELSSCEDDVIRGVRSQLLLWVARDADGHPVQVQVDAISSVLDTIFEVKAKKKK